MGCFHDGQAAKIRLLSAQGKTDAETSFVVTTSFSTRSRSINRPLQKTVFPSCLMIDLSCETDGNNEICLGVRFRLVLKALRLVPTEHCSWDSGHPLSSSFVVVRCFNTPWKLQCSREGGSVVLIFEHKRATFFPGKVFKHSQKNDVVQISWRFTVEMLTKSAPAN